MTPEEYAIARELTTLQTAEQRCRILVTLDRTTLEALLVHFASYESQFLDGEFNCRLINAALLNMDAREREYRQMSVAVITDFIGGAA